MPIYYLFCVIVSALNVIITGLVIPSINGFPPNESFIGNLVLIAICIIPNSIFGAAGLEYGFFEFEYEKRDLPLLVILLVFDCAAYAALVSFFNIYDILKLSGTFFSVLNWISIINCIFFGLPLHLSLFIITWRNITLLRIKNEFFFED